MNGKEKAELCELVDVLHAKGFQPLGILFYDPKTKLLGIGELSGVPNAFIEEISKRLGGMATPIGEII